MTDSYYDIVETTKENVGKFLKEIPLDLTLNLLRVNCSNCVEGEEGLLLFLAVIFMDLHH